MKMCKCGCGQPTPIAKRNDKKKGWIKGKPVRFIHNHHRRLSGVDYIIDEVTGCWIWQRAKDQNGYGMIGANGKRAHRAYYEANKGPISEGMQLDHLCRNHSCVNPDHLEPVTNSENQRRGAKAKLTYEKVAKIKRLRSEGKQVQEIAQLFKVDRHTVSRVLSGVSWT
jgi:hypothetical protein